MILAFIIACLAALAPVLRGSWDLWAQCLLHAITIVGFSAWLVIQIIIGYVPAPSFKSLAWVALLAVLGATATLMSPVYGLVLPEWWNLLNALWIFPAIAALEKDQRNWIDQSIRAASWILMLLAFYQRIALGQDRPTSALINQNVYAGAILMFLPLAIEKDDYLLAIGLIINLLWCRSVGAWLGLTAALTLTQRRLSPSRFWVGAAGCLVCAVVLYAKLGSPDAMNRWWWWKSALRMWWDHPLFGYGPGSFAFVLPAYLAKYPNGLFSYYAHNYPLQLAAEMGLFFCALWFAGLWHCIERTRSLKRFGVIAVLIHSLWDYTLSMPSNLFLLAYFAASSIPDTPDGINVPVKFKLPWAAVVVGACAALTGTVWREWDGQRRLSFADAAAAAGRMADARVAVDSARREIPRDPDVWLHKAALDVREDNWIEVAASLEEAVRLNPYRPSAWTELQLAYRRLGRPELADQAAARARPFLAVQS